MKIENRKLTRVDLISREYQPRSISNEITRKSELKTH